VSFDTVTEISLVPMTEPADGVPSSASTIRTAPAAPAAGELVGGTYRVTNVIGFGAMGVVVAAKDEALGRDVAIKLIRPDLSHPSFHQRFREEAQAMALVNHPNVVTIYSYGEHEGAPYFAMELVHGRPLDRLMWEERTLDLEFAVGLLDQACRGLEAIHATGTVHRDIKPGNILVDEGSRLRIGDLGLVASFRDSHAPREVVGTPGYMAPEVIGNSSATPMSDLYSLACVAYEMLVGKAPFENEDKSPGAKPLEAPSRPSFARPGLPVAFDAVLLEALATDPSLRTPSVELFRRALNQALHDAFEPTRILIVDDDDDQRESLQTALALEFAGADIETVADGAAALEAFERKPASVIVSDLNMPDVDGTSLTTRLRARDDAKNVPIIVLTGWGGPREWRELASIGADRFVLKPVNLGDLSGAIRRAMRERQGVG
jgi:eukaryotic-like serine/threonine-protein kinase